VKRHTPDPLRALLALYRRVDQARNLLQRTRDCDPAFERRVRNLVRLVDQRDREQNSQPQKSS
jgi:hypothetical protein